MFFRFVTKHACDKQTDKRKDGQTNGRTELRSQDRASIAASRGKTVAARDRPIPGVFCKKIRNWKLKLGSKYLPTHVTFRPSCESAMISTLAVVMSFITWPICRLSNAECTSVSVLPRFISTTITVIPCASRTGAVRCWSPYAVDATGSDEWAHVNRYSLQSKFTLIRQPQHHADDELYVTPRPQLWCRRLSQERITVVGRRWRKQGLPEQLTCLNGRKLQLYNATTNTL